MSASNQDYSAFIGKDHNQQGELATITALVEEQHAIERKIESLEEQLEKERAKLKDVSEFRLPEIMDSLGIEEFKTSSGIFVSVVEAIRASISAENKPKAFSWLENGGYGGLIKRKLEVAFGRDEEENANALLQELREKGMAAKFDKSVHSATLGAFVREQLKEGKDIPMDVFGVLRQRITKIKI